MEENNNTSSVGLTGADGVLRGPARSHLAVRRRRLRHVRLQRQRRRPVRDAEEGFSASLRRSLARLGRSVAVVHDLTRQARRVRRAGIVHSQGVPLAAQGDELGAGDR